MEHVFSWIWMLAGAASLYFLAMAVFAQGKWSHLFIAVVVSMVAKRVARGFLSGAQKKVLMNQLISEGYAPDEALEEYGQQLTTGEWSLARVQKIVKDYASALEQKAPGPNGMVADESQLPHPKIVIRNAILWLLDKGEIDDSQRDALKTGFLSLADFQPGVDIGDLGVDLGSQEYLSLPVEEQIKAVANSGIGGEWLEKSRKDRDLLIAELRRENHWSE